ncbi:LytTR family DNA-binding domain-containing protein [Urechidicola sp. KH5]
MISCIIIEDQLPAQRILNRYIQDHPELQIEGIYSNVFQAKEVLHKKPIDLLFLDIHLPKMSGIEFLKTTDNPPHVVLTTAFSEYALESYELNVIDYLLKPFSQQRFNKAVAKVIERMHWTENTRKPIQKRLYIKSGHEYYKIEIDTIRYINSDADYTDIYTHEKKYITSESLKHWEEKLISTQFMRIHKSYIVNLNHVIKTTAKFLFLTDEIKVPVGRTYKPEVQQKIKEFLN